ncbi:capsule assembly Wzi family protein [Spongiibacter sp. KMU-158]|uniref:Capsule assembly Wzi family protein n=1 Tax=Spongiibacter pelagi TaxID=2760804 RepID=A0A927GWT5_9GAMM|nr:capsule assembly Wzi family protein [Spongiibacter pelagi]MBD2859277.1 capsule assembly Wzi family protein [Spongiibacter pelagi]
MSSFGSRFLLCLLSGSVSSLALSAPWIDPGNIRMRHSLQYLADQGVVNSPVSTWPVMWSGVINGLNVSPAAAASQEYAYLQFERNWQTSEGGSGDIQLSGATEATLVRGFDAQPRDEAAATFGFEYIGEKFAGRLEYSTVSNPSDGEQERYDGSYLAATYGNVVLGAGAIDRWWGPGWQSSLILSNNARPIPSIWVSRKDTRPFDSDWLCRLGPWQLILFAGQLESDRAIPDAKLLGARFTFRPRTNLEIGLSRSIQWGGKGQDQSLSGLADTLMGDSNQAGQQDLANELAAVDARYSVPLGAGALAVYGQVAKEMESGGLFKQNLNLIGTDLVTHFGKGTQRWFVETGDTQVQSSDSTKYGVAYTHNRYQSGYYYNGRNIGPSYGGDARVATFGVMQFFENGHNLSVVYSSGQLNKAGKSAIAETDPGVQYFILKSNDKLSQVSVSYEMPAFGGALRLRSEFADKPIVINGQEQEQWQGFVDWTYRF